MRVSSCLVLLFLLALSTPKIIHLPPLSGDEQVYARLDQITYLDTSFSPFGSLSQIYKKEIY
jgi:hypothetical protein